MTISKNGRLRSLPVKPKAMEEKKGNKKVDISHSQNVIQDSNINAGGNVHIGNVYNYYGKPPTEVNSDLEEIRTLISKNRVEKAIEGLSEIARAKGPDALGEVQLLANRWEELQRQSRMGLVSYDQATTHRNQVVHSLLQAIQSLEKE